MAGSLTVLGACLLVSGAACTAGDDAAAVDAGTLVADADPYAPDARPCPAPPSFAPGWLSEYQDEIVAKLAGAQPIELGVTLSDRATVSRRAVSADFIEAELVGQGYTAKLHDYGTGTNVWAELPATSAGDAWIVLGAHYDSVSGSPGANDNATGVALVLSVARYLRTVECRSVNVLFVLFDEEEIGLVGSAAFAAMLADDDRRDVISVHTVDQMGWDSDDDRAIELERPSAGLLQLYAAAKNSGGFSTPLVETSTGGTDHVSFRARGFRTIGLTEGFVSGDSTPHYHAATDTYSTVKFAYLASTTQLVNHALVEVVQGKISAAARSQRSRPAALSGRLRGFDSSVERWVERAASQEAHGCRGARAPSSPMSGAVSPKSAAESF